MNLAIPIERPQIWERLTAFLLFFGVFIFFTIGSHHQSLRPEVHFLALYSPGRFAHGFIQTIVFSAMLVPRMHIIGTTTAILFAVLLPYFLWAGVFKTLRMYFIPHIVATLVAAAIIFCGAALGWHWAHTMVWRRDMGASCGLAAVTAGMGLLLWRRWVIAGAAIFAGLGLIYTYEVVAEPSLTAVEHILAVATALIIGTWWA